jgi:hypothetical protein
MLNMKKIILEILSEIVNPDDISLSSFNQKKYLNDVIWIDEKINTIVRKKLLKITKDYFNSLGLDWVKLEDIVLTGSLANYNWSRFSDLDLHLILDFSNINENEELVKDYLDSKRKIWNDTHNIKIYGFDVEIYTQDINEEHTSSGVYSLLNDKWLVKPEHEEVKLDRKLIKKKSSEIMNKIDGLCDLYKSGEYNAVLEEYDKLWDKIKKMRKSGLERDGEYSYENITFKVLRRSKYIEKLIDWNLKSYDKANSL